MRTPEGPGVKSEIALALSSCSVNQRNGLTRPFFKQRKGLVCLLILRAPFAAFAREGQE